MKLTTQGQSIILIGVLLVFTIIGLILGSPRSITANSFGEFIRAFASDGKTQAIFGSILIDVLTGVISSLRAKIFDMQRLGDFYLTNVIPYLLGYMLFWITAFFGLGDVLPATLTNGIASIGYAAIMAALLGSILDNLQRARTGTTQPEEIAMSTVPPIDPKG